MGADRMHRVLPVSIILSALLAVSCARLPYTTTVVHEDARIVVKLQQEIKPVSYSHPVQLATRQIAAVLSGFTIRGEQRLPLRWFAEEAPPKRLFREDEAQALAPHLAEALQKAGPAERVYFEVIAPGFNPRSRHDVTAGWIAVREPYLQLQVEYFHSQLPVRKSSEYDYNHPTPRQTPDSYILYFEPGRFWVTDPVIQGRVVDLRGFLKSAHAPAGDKP